jgi:DNA-binding MarR family transcriptional regulator
VTAAPDDPIAEARRQWRAHGLGEPEVMAAVTSVFRVHQLLLARLNGLLVPHALTFARYEVLQLLAFSRRGSLPLSVVGDRLQVHPASVTNAVARLERDGLLERRPHPDDGRAVVAHLTERGRAVAAAATADLVAARFGADGLDEEGAVRLGALLAPLRAAADD